MNEYLFLIPIALALLVGAMSPGPSFLVVAQTAMEKSRLHGIACSLGTGTGAVIFVLIASLGLFFILETVPWLYGLFKFLGGIYLLFLAYKIWLNANQPMQTSDYTTKEKSLFKSYLLGVFTQLSNPKTSIVIGSIIMAFLPSDIPSYSYVLLAIISFVIDAGWYAIVAILLTTPKAQKVYLRFKKNISRVASGLMGFMGAKLVLNQ